MINDWTPVGEGLPVKRNEEIMEILEAFDLTGSYHAAAELAGCDHHTVARYVELRDAGQPPVAREHRTRPIDDYLDKIEELVVRSDGRVRAEVVHDRITAIGFTGGERTTRRCSANVFAWQAVLSQKNRRTRSTTSTRRPLIGASPRWRR